VTDNNKNEEAGGKPSGALPLASSIGSRNLIIIIVTMPLVFAVVLLGTILIFGKHKRQPGEDAPSALPAFEAGPLSSGDAPAIDPAPLILPAGAEIASMALDGDRLVLQIARPGEDREEIIVYDLSRGAQTTRIPVIRQLSSESD